MKHVKKCILIALCFMLSFISVAPGNGTFADGIDSSKNQAAATKERVIAYTKPEPVQDPNNKITLSADDQKAAMKIFKPEYFDDDNFYQLNLNVLPKEVYKLDGFNREVKFTDKSFECDFDTTHISDAYIAPVLDNGTTYMSIYDVTCIYSSDALTEAFMNLMETNRTLRNDIMTASEYAELKKVYNTYKDSEYDVNAYVYHYIVELMDLVFGDKLFDFDFYCETYPALAILYDYNEAALKQHFYSIGLYEGRQGCANFNPSAYRNVTEDIAKLIILYGLYLKRTYPKTKGCVYQKRLYDPDFYAYVADVSLDHKNSNFIEDLPCAYVQGEANALASYRMRYELNQHHVQAHDGMNDFIDDVLISMYSNGNICENKWTDVHNHVLDVNELLMFHDDAVVHDAMYNWRKSKAHYDAAVNDKFVYTGVGHAYYNYNPELKGCRQRTHSKFYAIGFCVYFTPKSGFGKWAAKKLKY